MKLFSLLFFALLVSGCVAPRPTALLYFDRAEEAIGQQNWEVAYRFLEDGFISDQPKIKTRAVSLVNKYPEILVAGEITFSSKNIAKTLLAHGSDRGIDLEQKRLAMFKVVATSAAYEFAKSNVQSAALAINEKKDKDEQARKEADRKKQELRISLLEAMQKSRFLCQNKIECEKAFSLTQIFVSEKSDMKIQVATNTIVETYNPTEAMNTALRAIKIPQRGETAEIVLTASCRDEGRDSFKDICDRKLLSIYVAYPSFMQSAMRP